MGVFVGHKLLEPPGSARKAKEGTMKTNCVANSVMHIFSRIRPNTPRKQEGCRGMFSNRHQM